MPRWPACSRPPRRKRIAESLASGEKGAIFLGNFAQQHAQAATLHALAQQLAELTGARFGTLGEAANSVGGYLAKAVPGAQGLNAARMLAEPRKAYFVLHAEPELDCANPGQAMAALKGADLVVALTPFKTRALDYAHVILPVAPFTETSGTFINTEGRVQSFHAVVKPQGETRPAWKVLRVLGNLLGLAGFEQDSSRSRAQRGAGRQAGFGRRAPEQPGRWRCDRSCRAAPALQRIADVPIHFADPLARRAPSLQKTRDAAPPAARMNAATLAKLGLIAGMQVKVSTTETRAGTSLGGTAILAVQLDAGVPDGCVRVAAGHELTARPRPDAGRDHRGARVMEASWSCNSSSGSGTCSACGTPCGPWPSRSGR
jgi:NADH-quinone oxidoreductase subunit G